MFSENSPYLSWSLMSPKPIVVHIAQHDEHIVFWNGMVMTHAHALNLILVPYGIYATPKTKRAVTTNFRKLYKTGVFGDVKWDNTVYKRDYYNYVKDKLSKHVTSVCQNVDVYEAVSWLNTAEATVVDKNVVK